MPVPDRARYSVLKLSVSEDRVIRDVHQNDLHRVAIAQMRFDLPALLVASLLGRPCGQGRGKGRSAHRPKRPSCTSYLLRLASWSALRLVRLPCCKSPLFPICLCHEHQCLHTAGLYRAMEEQHLDWFPKPRSQGRYARQVEHDCSVFLNGNPERTFSVPGHNDGLRIVGESDLWCLQN